MYKLVPRCPTFAASKQPLAFSPQPPIIFRSILQVWKFFDGSQCLANWLYLPGRLSDLISLKIWCYGMHVIFPYFPFICFTVLPPFIIFNLSTDKLMSMLAFWQPQLRGEIGCLLASIFNYHCYKYVYLLYYKHFVVLQEPCWVNQKHSLLICIRLN